MDTAVLATVVWSICMILREANKKKKLTKN